MNEEDEIIETGETQEVQGNKGLSIAAMVLGIISVALFCIWYIALPCAILAIVFGVKEKKKNKNNKMAKSGFILGIISIILTIALIIVSVIISVSFNNALFESARSAREASDRAERLERVIQQEAQLQQQLKDF